MAPWRGRALVVSGALTVATALASAPARAGPPYETDDPEPTDLHHWEIYGFTAVEGRGGELAGASGVDLNYGPVAGVQLTATLPVEYEKTAGQAARIGRGDVEVGVKYRFLDRPDQGVSAAIFPRIILPTSGLAGAGARTRLLLPVWGQQDFGKTALFGGGGYEINPGRGNRDFLVAGAAVTRALSKRLSIGGEVTHSSADTTGGHGRTSLGLGSIVQLGGPYSLLLSGGPAWSGGQSSYHAYAALGLNF